jgi:precorrin-6B methylase 2
MTTFQSKTSSVRVNPFISFNTLHSQIQFFLSKYDISNQNKIDKKYKLPLSDAIFCAEDPIRNKVFWQGIKKAIDELKEKKREIVVVDAGAGTGILGIFALALGANKCYFLEHNPHSLKLCQKLVKSFNWQNRSVFVQCDAVKYKLPENYDLLISETISSGFVNEDFPKIINHLKQFSNSNSIIIPAKFNLIIKEEDNSTHPLTLVSKQGFKTQKISLNNPKKHKLTFTTKACIYNNFFLKSGDSMSFLNPRTINLKTEKHPLFTFI